MATYEVYYHPIRKFSTIKRGFIWPAFWFGPLWLLYRRCWFSGNVFLGVTLVLGMILEATSAHAMAPPATGQSGNADAVIFPLGFGYFLLVNLLHVAIGALASRLVRSNLKARGFVLVGKYNCKTGDAALALLHKEKKKK